MFYSAVKAIFKTYLDLTLKPEVVGAEHIPQQGPAIVCANHLHWLDPVLIACYIPRQVHFMAKRELFQIPVFAQVLRALGAFPVNRGKADRSAIRTALAMLAEGKVLGIFPEGTRSSTGELGEFFDGTALLAFKSGAPVVPAAITGSYSERQICLRFGMPLRAKELGITEVKEMTLLIRQQVEGLTK
ncbi:MAG: lysophospholipid acyltransferase family protein [Bacillota bacterium]